MGLALLPELIIQDEIQHNQLVKIALDIKPEDLAFYLYYLPTNDGSRLWALAHYLTQETCSLFSDNAI